MPYGHELQKEAEAHLELAKLLQKARPAAKQGELRRILQSDSPIGRKIAEIRRLDAARPERAPADDGPAPRPSVASAASPFRFTVPKLRALLKPPQTRLGLFPYLFRELKNIVQFGYMTHTLAPIALLPVLRLDKRLVARLAALQRDAEELVELSRPVIASGWKLLSKREYNLVVALDRLCRELVATNFRALNFRDRDLIDKLHGPETWFFALVYRSDDPELVAQALDRALAEGPNGERAKAEQASILAKRILYRDFAMPSLYNILLTLNMIKYRRFLAFEQLVSSDLGEILNVAEFAVDEGLRREIDAFVEELKSAVLSLGGSSSEIGRIHSHIRTEPSGEPDYGLLGAFYESGIGKEEGWIFARDRESVVVFMPRLLRSFNLSFTAFLTGRVTLASGEKAQVFAPELFLGDLQRLAAVASKLDRLFFDLRVFSYSRYLQIKRDGRGAIAAEAEAIGDLQAALSTFLAIARRLARLPAPSDGVQAGASASRPIDASALSDGRAALPHANEAIRSRHYLDGRAVGEAIGLVVSICYLAAGYLYDKELLAAISQERSVAKRLETQLETLKRIAGEEVFEAVAAQLVVSGLNR